MSKMGSHIPFEYLKYKLWPKKRSGVKLPIWLPTTKIQESPWFTFVQVACNISLESSQQRLQLCFKHHFKKKYEQKVMGLQSHRNPNFEIFKNSQFESPKTKWHLDVTLVANHREYYKGEGGDFPQVWDVVNLVSPCMPMARPCTKSVSTTH